MSMIKFATLATAAVLLAKISPVSAHGVVTGIVVDGEYNLGYDASSFPYMTPAPVVAGWTTDDQNRGFIAPDAYQSEDIICHKSATPGGTHISVAAGDSVELQWSVWPAAHWGPVLDYLASCNGECESVDKTSLEFFKIAERGLIDGSPSPGTWASNELFANNNSWTVTIPSSIKAGNYVLRHEVIALHQANDFDGAQNYPQCINLEITGSGTESPAGIPATQFYTENDPGIYINIYYPTLTNYTIPGPPVFSAAAAASVPSSSASTVGNSSAASSTSTVSMSSASSSMTSALSSSSVSTSSASSSMTSALSSSSVSTSSASSSLTAAASTSSATVSPGAFYPIPTSDSSIVVASTSTNIDPTTTDSASTSFTTTTVTTTSMPTGQSDADVPVSQAMASTTSALPSTTSATEAAAAAATTSSGAVTVPSITGLSATQLMQLMSDVLTALQGAFGQVNHKIRRHARDLAF